MAANVQSMCQYWKNFNLQELQKELDTTVTELAKRQDESDVSRRRLVDQSREFKKNTPEDIRKIVAALLKSFQIEVDNLSKRSKSAEAAFLSVYKKLINLPDPVPALEYALQIQKKAHRVSDLEIENKQLRETLEEYNHEFAEVKNQEVTIKQLKEKIKEYEEKLETTAELRTKEKERELQRFFAEKERQLQETQLAVARKLGEAEQKISTLHAALEAVQSELFEVKSKYDEATSAKSDEMEMVISDVERANERAAAAERQVEQLKQQLASASQSVESAQQIQKNPDAEQAMDILKRSSMEVELTAKEKEISQLVEDVQRLQASLTKLRESTSLQISKLEEEISSKNTAFRLLEEKLRTQEDYEEIKRELNIMKSVEFSGISNDEDQKSKSLETLLLEKNKALQTENTQLKVTNSDITGTETPKMSSSPSTSQQSADGFATVLGEEIAQSYQNSNPPSRNPSESIESSPSASGLPPDTPPVSYVHSISRSDTPHFMPPPPVFSFPNCHIPQGFMPVNMTSKSDSSGGLDTSMVAKTVRELLSIHNIGQRLFAKHVLGLSQGTVSELLSKPKTWDKLTEKGRESYRKMFAWANEDRNILALKAISPKKGKNCTQPLVSTVKSEDSATEERIAQILNDAQQAMQVKKNMEQVCNQQVANAVVSSIYQQEVSKMVGSSPLPQNIVPTALSAGVPVRETPRRRTTDDSRQSRNSVSSQESEASAQDMVARIYRQELEKLAKAAESAGNIAASTMYQQELARITYHNQFKQSLNNHEFHFGGPHRLQNGVSIKSEPPDSTSDDTRSPSSSSINNNNNNGPIDLSKPHSSSAPTSPKSAEAKDAGRQAGSAFFLVHPRINGHDSFENGQFPTQFAATLDGLSPLQRMQNIANSLSSRPHLNVAASKPLRAVLPPITQEQFDEYSNVNTDDLVKKVKETLSQYSISQRLFGENVLGLSQGSVSDLLARPKPWHMLTQKGREPFIRMQLFLEDAEAIPKLVASQYKIPPDMLLRGISGSETNVSITAHRRRKNSMEDRYYDSPGHAKRPRVFFTEEQKDALRVAYSEDPYPSQSTIEALANDLNVGVKTVINWFHNHRMRAKQQHHSGVMQDHSVDELSSVKSEPMDDSSNQSDGSSGSGEPSHLRNFQNNETRQWMFPQFEPVQRSKHDGSEGENSQHSDEEIASKKEQELCDAGISDNEDEVDSASVPKTESEKTDTNSENVPCSMPAPPPSGVNKRKRSNPQRVFEGAQLDKTKALEKPEQNDVPDDSALKDTETAEMNGGVSSDPGSNSSASDDRFNKIEKLQKAIELAGEEWEEFDRDASIEKLEKNIENNADEDWEF